MKQYSPSENAFYDTVINSVMPSDVFEISEKEWGDLLEGQTHGKLICCGVDMRPCLTGQPLPTADELIRQAEDKRSRLRAEADMAIQPLQDGKDLGMITDEEVSQLIAWKKYRVMLMRVNTETPENIMWPEQPVQ